MKWKKVKCNGIMSVNERKMKEGKRRKIGEIKLKTGHRLRTFNNETRTNLMLVNSKALGKLRCVTKTDQVIHCVVCLCEGSYLAWISNGHYRCHHRKNKSFSRNSMDDLHWKRGHLPPSFGPQHIDAAQILMLLYFIIYQWNEIWLKRKSSEWMRE